jgi:hypothetical protein
MGYNKPKKHLHREFLYLNQDTIVNSLSALEAGAVDEIIQKANEAREGGIQGGVGAGPLNVGGGKKKASNIEEQMVRTRTVFSAFDAWYTHLKDADAIGTFDKWDVGVRDDLETGDTIEFEGRLTLTPVHRVLRTFINFAEQADTPGSVFQQKGEDLKETKKTARMMQVWLGGKDAPQHFPVYMAPYESDEPRMVARLDEEYMLSPKEGIDGLYKVIAQVDEILREGDEISAIRIIRDVPPTSMEVETISEALSNFIEPATELGVTITPDDISVPYPAVIVRPIAVFR